MLQNQFKQEAILGQTDLRFNGETISVQVDAAEAGTLVAGQAVKLAATLGGVPKVVACAANTDEAFGFINFEAKDAAFKAGDKVEISQKGNVMYLEATTVIARGAEVTLDIAAVGGVATKVIGERLVGYALDGAAAIGDIIRVKISSPSFTLAV